MELGEWVKSNVDYGRPESRERVPDRMSSSTENLLLPFSASRSKAL